MTSCQFSLNKGIPTNLHFLYQLSTRKKPGKLSKNCFSNHFTVYINIPRVLKPKPNLWYCTRCFSWFLAMGFYDGTVCWFSHPPFRKIRILIHYSEVYNISCTESNNINWLGAFNERNQGQQASTLNCGGWI